MSYADAAKSGPEQSAEEYKSTDKTPSRAPAMPQIEQTQTSEASLIDVDHPSVETVPSNFASQEIKTDSQAAQHEREEEDAEKPQADTNNEQQREQKSGSSKLRQNADNPVLLGNAVVTAALAGVLGWTGYRWYQQGVAGSKIFAGAVAAIGVFAVGDYFGSRYLLSKYPPKNQAHESG